MIVFDTETSGLIGPQNAPLDTQPEIIEFAAIKLDDHFLEEQGRLTFLCKPSREIVPKITEITGLTNEDLKGQPSFARKLPLVEDFFRGERFCAAHNCGYDIGMMELELRRLNRVRRFPWPTEQLCTVELTTDIKGYRLKLGQLYEIAMGKPMAEAHRAMVDVEHLVEVVRWLRAQGKI